MNMKLLSLPLGLLLLLSCSLSQEAIAAPSVTVGSVSDTVYEVRGNDFSNASGIDVTIRYDPAALAGPQVAQGALVGGALMAVNASTPGKIRLALVRVAAINGSGTIATITFTRVKSTGADIQSVVSSAISGSGQNMPVTSQVMNAAKTTDSGVSTSQQSGQSTDGATPAPGSPAASAAAPMGIVGMVIPPSGATSPDVQSAASGTNQPVPDTREPEADAAVPSTAAKVFSDETTTVKAKDTEPERKKVPMFPSVLDRFRDFKGEKTPEALMALFSPQKEQAKQDPPIVLSNGKATVKIVLELDSKGESNNFLLDGVNLVSLKNKEKNFWIVELLPDPRAYEATISVPWKKEWHVIPLTTAPPMDVNIDRSATRLTEADFKVYLKTKGTIKEPRFDLNGDGVRNYIDDYIFTANYLSQRSEVTMKPSIR
jgi:hypothetical protein